MLEYSQDNYMKNYIMLNTHMRTKATTEFEKDFTTNTSAYGETMDNVHSHINFQ